MLKRVAKNLTFTFSSEYAQKVADEGPISNKEAIHYLYKFWLLASLTPITVKKKANEGQMPD